MLERLYQATLGRIVDLIAIALSGKRIAVLGARGVGKTHFAKFLTGQTTPIDYKQTVAPEKLGSHRVQLSELDVRLKAMFDLGGAEEARAQWQKQVEKADYVFYLLRADRAMSGHERDIDRISRDGEHIANWLKARDPRPKFCIVGTHADNDAAFRGQSHSLHGDYTSRFRSIPVIKKFVRQCGGASQVEVVVGSMQTPGATAELLTDVFRHVASDL